MANSGNCEFPFCDNNSENAKREGTIFKLNRIPISRPLSDKWELVFKFRLDDRIGQHLLICNRHFDETNRRLILPQPSKKSTTLKNEVARPPPPATKPQEVSLKRRAAKESLAKMQKSLKDEDEEEPPAKIKKERMSNEDEDFEIDDEDDDDFIPPVKPQKPVVAKKKLGRPRKVDTQPPSSTDTSWWGKSHTQQSDTVSGPVKAETSVTDPKQKRSWWGDDSDSDHFGGDANDNDEGGGDDGFAKRDSSPEPAEPQSTVVGANENLISELETSLPVKSETKPLDSCIQDVFVRIEKIDTMYEHLYDRPIEEACEEAIAYGRLRDNERKSFGKQYDVLLEKYRYFSDQLHRAKWRNEQLIREIKIKTNKITFLQKTFGSDYSAAESTKNVQNDSIENDDDF